MKIRTLLVLFISVSMAVNSFGQKSQKVKLCELISSMDQMVHRIEQFGEHEKNGSREDFGYDIQLIDRLQLEHDSISWFVQRANSIKFNHFFQAKFFHQWTNAQFSISQLKEAVVVFEAYKQTLPDSLNGHIGPDKRQWKERFDPWIQDVYWYNIEPSVINAAILPVILNYRQYRSSIQQMKQALPEKWRAKIDAAKCYN